MAYSAQISPKGLMTEGPILKKIIIFSVPLVIGNLLQQLYNIVDAMVVGHFVGDYALAAVGASFHIIFMLIGFLIGLTTGSGIIVSQFYGALNTEKLQQTVHTAFALSLIMGVVFSLLGFLLSPTILNIIDTPAEVFADSSLYLRITFIGILPILIYNMGASILRSVGDSKTPIYYLAVAVAINIILDVVFVAILKFGVAGVAIATFIAQTVAAILTIRKLCRVDADYRLNLRAIALSKGITGQILKVSLPNGLQQTIIGLSGVVIQSFVNANGPLVMAAFNAHSRIDGLIFLPIMSFSLAITVFCGQNIGAHKIDRFHKAVKYSVWLGIGYALITGALYIIFSAPLLGMFTTDAQVVAYGQQFIIGMVPYYFLFGLIFILNGAINGTGHTFITMVIAVSNYCILRVIILYFAQDYFDGIDLISFGYVVTWSTSVIAILITYFKGSWRKCLV